MVHLVVVIDVECINEGPSRVASLHRSELGAQLCRGPNVVIVEECDPAGAGKRQSSLSCDGLPGVYVTNHRESLGLQALQSISCTVRAPLVDNDQAHL